MREPALQALFPNMNDFRSYVSGVDSSIRMEDLDPAATAARKQLENILTVKLFQKIVDESLQAATNITAQPSDLKNSLCTAWANATMQKQLVFEVIRNRKAEIEVYKYELEAMKRTYLDNFYNAMDSIISCIQDTEEWQKTAIYAQLETVPIKTTEEFNALHPIDNSYYFFFRILPFQQEVFDSHANYQESIGDDKTLLRIYHRALAKLTLAKAVQMFDMAEFPATIRNLYDDSKAYRIGVSEQRHLLDVATKLQNEGEQLLKQLSEQLYSEENNVSTETSFNTPADNIILMP